jgi:hypothetical protein
LLIVCEAIAYVVTSIDGYVVAMKIAVTVKLTPHHRGAG